MIDRYDALRHKHFLATNDIDAFLRLGKALAAEVVITTICRCFTFRISDSRDCTWTHLDAIDSHLTVRDCTCWCIAAAEDGVNIHIGIFLHVVAHLHVASLRARDNHWCAVANLDDELLAFPA